MGVVCRDGARRGGQWVWFAGKTSLASHCEGECARGEEINEKHKFLSSPVARPREEEGGTVSLKTTSFCSFFFIMKRHRSHHNTSNSVIHTTSFNNLQTNTISQNLKQTITSTKLYIHTTSLFEKKQ
jgi:hypothetical protein